jgi:hypothetical protein
MASKAGYTLQGPVIIGLNGAIGNLSVNEENQKHLKVSDEQCVSC